MTEFLGRNELITLKNDVHIWSFAPLSPLFLLRLCLDWDRTLSHILHRLWKGLYDVLPVQQFTQECSSMGLAYLPMDFCCSGIKFQGIMNLYFLSQSHHPSSSLANAPILCTFLIYNPSRILSFWTSCHPIQHFTAY